MSHESFTSITSGNYFPRGNEFNIYYDKTTRAEGEEALASTPSLWRRAATRARPAYLLDNLDYCSIKIVIPTFLQVWITVILATVPKTSAWFGNASYLMQILGFICASGGLSVCINVIMASTCFAAMVVGWLFTVVAMSISARIRGWPTTQDVANALINEGSCDRESITTCMSEEIFTGRYLDTKATIVFSISLVIGITCFGIFVNVHKMARLVYVCGCISIIINTCYANFIPTFAPLEVGLIILKPAGFAFALKVVVSCLVYPFTSSFKYFDVGTNLCGALLDVSSRNKTFFKSMKPSQDSFSNYQGLLKDIQAIRLKLSAADVFLQSTCIEISFSRFTHDDAHEFSSRMKALLNTFSGYEYFYESMQERKDILREEFYPKARRGSLTDSETSSQSKLFAAFSHTYQDLGRLEDSRVQQLFKNKYFGEPHRPKSLKDLDIVTDHIKEAHACYLDALSSSLEVARRWMSDANEYRLYGIFTRTEQKQKQKARHNEILLAHNALKEFMVVQQEAQNDLSLKMLEGMEGHEQILSLISQTSLFLFLSKQIAVQLLSLLSFFLTIDEKRPSPIIVWPKLKSSKGQAFDPYKKDMDPVTKEGSRQRDPDSLAPQTPLQILMWSLVKVYKCLLMEEYSFWFHCAMLVNFCCFPFYFQSSAHYFYSRKLVWFPIMCAVSTSQYYADSVYMFSTKVVYTFIGSVIGMVAWYISTGSGDGNFYGYATVCAIVYFVASYYRQFSVHLLPVAGIMICITPALVLGTSWVDSQYNASNVGVGWKVAVTRFISVIAGLSVAFTTTFFPRVRSSKAAFRKKLAAAMECLNEIQNQVCNFAYKRYNDPGTHIRRVDDKLSDNIRNHLLDLASLKSSMSSIQYETPLTGSWPTEEYQKLLKLIVSISQLYYLHYRLLDQVYDTNTWIPHMVNRAAWNKPEFLSQLVSLIYMASESLRLKAELPDITTATLSIKHLEVLSQMWGTQEFSFNERLYAERKMSGQSQVRRRKLQALDFDSLLGHDGRLNVVALQITHMIYKQIDQAVLIVKGLVGEKYIYDPRLFEL